MYKDYIAIILKFVELICIFRRCRVKLKKWIELENIFAQNPTYKILIFLSNYFYDGLIVFPHNCNVCLVLSSLGKKKVNGCR